MANPHVQQEYREYFESDTWQKHNEQGVLSARTFFQLDGLGMFLACIIVLTILLKQYYNSQERKAEKKKVLQKLVSKDGSTVLFALVVDRATMIRNSGVIETINRIPGAVVSALVVVNDEGATRKELDRTAVQYAVNKVYRNLKEALSSQSVGAVVLDVESLDASTMEQCILSGKHVLSVGSLLRNADDARAVRDMIVKQDKLEYTKAPRVVFDGGLSYRYHPLYNRFLARCRLMEPITDVRCTIRVPGWQASAMSWIRRVPFLMHVFPKRLYAPAMSCFSSNGFSANEQVVDMLRLVLADVSLDLLGGTGEASPACSATTAQDGTISFELASVGGQKRTAQVRVESTTWSNWWYTSTTVEASSGDSSRCICENLHFPSTGHALTTYKANGHISSEHAYGMGGRGFDQQVLAFVKAVRDSSVGSDTTGPVVRLERVLQVHSLS